MLGGMAALPGTEWDRDSGDRARIVTVSHAFTHFTLDLDVVTRSNPPPGEGWWQPLDCWQSAGLPTLYARAIEAMLARKDDLAA